MPVHVTESVRGRAGQGPVPSGPQLVQRAQLAFDTAGLAVRMACMPLRRSLHELQANQMAFCLLGPSTPPSVRSLGATPSRGCRRNSRC